MLIARAAQPHSVFRSSPTFTAEGIPEIHLARHASPWTCFADSGEGTGEGGGGSGEPPKTFTQEQVNSFLAKEQKKIEDRLAKQYGEASAKTQAELDALKIQIEENGKSAAEKERLAAERARAGMESKLSEQSKAIAERDALLAQSNQRLRDTLVDHELNALFAKANVMPAMMRAALLVFRNDAKLEHGDDGAITSVDVGTKRFASLGEAVADWMKENGAGYTAAPKGGAGTQLGNAGSGSGPAFKRSTDDNIAAADAQRASRRS